LGDKRNCRVALGASENPKCTVHPAFRCVVVVDEGAVDYTDPPFLNRFEKHIVNCVDALSPRMLALLPRLTAWVGAASAIRDGVSGRALDFDAADAFGGFGMRRGVAASQDEPLAALLLQQTLSGAEAACSDDELLLAAKGSLLATCSMDAVLRLSHSALAQAGGAVEVTQLQDAYFGAAEHASLTAAIEHCVLRPAAASADAAAPARLLVLTHSSFLSVKECFADDPAVVILKLGAFGCEAKLSEALAAFWRSPGSAARTLVVQAAASHDAAHIALCKHLMEAHEREFRDLTQRARLAERREFGRVNSANASGSGSAAAAAAAAPTSPISGGESGRLRAARSVEAVAALLKHQLMVLHLRRGQKDEADTAWNFSGLSGWQQVAVDAVNGSAADAADLQTARTTPLADWIASGAGADGNSPSEALLFAARAELPWCFRELSYTATDSGTVVAHTRSAAALLCSAAGAPLLRELCAVAVEALHNDTAAAAPDWLSALACARHALLEDATMVSAMRRAARLRLRLPLLRIVHALECKGALASLQSALMAAGEAPNEARVRLWRCVHMQPGALLAAATQSVALAVPCLSRSTWPPSSLVMSAASRLRAAYFDADGRWLPRRAASGRNLVAQLVSQLDKDPSALRVLMQCADALSEEQTAAAALSALRLQEHEQDQADDAPLDDAEQPGEEGDAVDAAADADDGAAPLQAQSAASEKLSSLLLAYADEYVADVLRAEADATVQRNPELTAERVAALLTRALPAVLPHPAEVHVQLWRAQGALSGILELDGIADGRAAPGGDGSVAGFGYAALSAACAAHLARLATTAHAAPAMHAWLCTAQRAKVLGSTLLAELADRPAPPSLDKLRMITDVASFLFGSLQGNLGVACAAVQELAAADTDDAVQLLELTRAALARLKAGDAAGAGGAATPLVRQLDSCFASITLRLLEQDATAIGTSAFNSACAAAFGTAWTWGAPDDSLDDAAGPPMLASIMTHLLYLAIPDDDTFIILDADADASTAGELNALLAAALAAGAPATVIMCDVLQREAAARIAEAALDGDSEAAAAARFKRAVDIMLLDASDTSVARERPLQLLAAIGYAKAFCMCAAAALAPDAARACGFSDALLQALPPLDAGDVDTGTPARALKAFLLRELQRAGGMSAQACARACGTEDGRLATLLPCLFRLPWPVPAASRLGFNPFAGRAHFCAARDCMLQLMRTREEPAELRTLTAGDAGAVTAMLAAASVTLLAAAPPAQAQRAALAAWCAARLGAATAAGSVAQMACLRGELPPALVVPRACDAADAPFLSSALLHLMAACPAGPLREYMSGGVHAAHFMLAGQGRGAEFERLLLTLQVDAGAHFRRYRCACGFAYPVGDCGQTSEMGTCPTCRRDIGNQRGAGPHNAVATSTRLDEAPISTQQHLEAHYPEQPGYAPYGGDARATMLSERGLTPATFRLLHIVTHLALAAAALTPGVTLPPSVAPAAVWGAVHDDWFVLTQLLPGATRDGLAMLLHRVIATCLPAHPGALRDAASRAEWEAAFADNVAPLLADLPATLVACAAAYAYGARASPLEAQMAEHGGAHDASWRPGLMRCVALPRFAELQDALANAPGAEVAHPLLCYALSPRGTALLRSAALLPPLVRWVRIAVEALDHRITRAASLERDVASLLAQLDEEAREAYAAFVAAWETVRVEQPAQQFLCQQFQLPQLAGADGAGVRLALFCPAAAGAGAVVPTALKYVADAHNLLLAEVSLLAPRCAALRFRCLASATAPQAQAQQAQQAQQTQAQQAQLVRGVRFAALQPRDMLSYGAHTEAHLTRFSRPRLGAGPGVGRAVRYDLAAAEGELAVLLAAGARVEGSPPALRFQGEALNADSSLLSALRESVPQAAALPGAEALARDLARAAASSGSSAETFALLAALESLCFYAGRAGGAPADAMLDFAADWLAAAERACLLRVPGVRLLRLEHCEALFMAVEDAVADELVETVDAQYKADVPPGVAVALRALCGAAAVAAAPPAGAPAAAADAQARAGALADALKRFVARYLAGEVASGFNTGNSLALGYLPLLSWKPGDRHLVPELQDGLPEELLLPHAYQAWRQLVALREEMRARAQCRPAAAAAAAAAGAAAHARAAPAGRRRPMGRMA
jgi:hypothetical protein